MSSKPLLNDFDEDELVEMPTDSDTARIKRLERRDGQYVLEPGVNTPPLDDPAAPSQVVSSRKQRISDLFTIFCAGCALISDGYANSLMTLVNVILYSQYPAQYTSVVATRVSNALLVGEICGQITIG